MWEDTPFQEKCFYHDLYSQVNGGYELELI